LFPRSGLVTGLQARRKLKNTDDNSEQDFPQTATGEKSRIRKMDRCDLKSAVAVR